MILSTVGLFIIVVFLALRIRRLEKRIDAMHQGSYPGELTDDQVDYLRRSAEVTRLRWSMKIEPKGANHDAQARARTKIE